MTAAAKDLLVTLCGLVTGIATAGMLATYEIKGHFAVYAFTLWFVIPLGAIISGFFASSGYGIGAKLLQHRLHRFFILNLIGLSVLTYFLLNYMVYSTLVINGQRARDVLGFGQYMDLVIQNRQLSFLGLASLGTPGFLGYVLVFIQLVGFVAGGLIVYRGVAAQLYCEKCHRYLTITSEWVKYESAVMDVGEAYQSAKAAFKSGNAEAAVRLVSGLPGAASGTMRLALKLGRCGGCLAEFYDLSIYFQENNKWYLHPDYRARGPVQAGTDSVAATVSLAESESVAPARIAVSLAALAIPVVAVLIAQRTGLTNSSALFLEGTRYLTGKGVVRDEPRAAEYYRKAALAGNSIAMIGLAELYRDGKGVPQDFSQARSWFERAASNGYALAMLDLGLMYASGQGGGRDEVNATKWFGKAAENGDPDAMFNLAVLYSSGTTVPRNLPRARDLFQKASKAGRVAALHNLGWIEQNAAPPNYAGAVAYYEQAAALGYAKSMATLGGLYSLGRGVPKDPVTARHWFMLGASKGEPIAMLNLGVMMVAGKGGNRDVAEGRQWIAKAAAAGNPLAISTMQALERGSKSSPGHQSGTQK